MTHLPIIHAIGSVACFALVGLAVIACICSIARAAGWTEAQPEDNQ